LSQKELTRYGVIENTIEGYLNVDETREQLHLSIRQIFRLKRKLRQREELSASGEHFKID